MNQARLSGPQELFAARDEIAATLYENVAASERTLIFRLLTQSFADEYVRAVMEGRTPAVVAWAEEMCAQPGRAKAVAQLFEAARTLGTYLSERGLPERYLAQLPALGDIVQAVAASERGAGRPDDHLDEIDAAIAELLARLRAVDPRKAARARSATSWCARLARRLGMTREEVVSISRFGSLRVAQGFESNALLDTFAETIHAHSSASEIVTVAARFSEALAGDATRAPLPPETAVDEVVARSGTRYDPEVVAALRELVAAT